MHNYNKIFKLLYSLLFVTLLASCGDEELVGLAFYDADLEGISVNKEHQATIPSEGICFKIRVFSKSQPSSSVCLHDYCVDDSVYSPINSPDYLPSDKPYFGNKEWLKGDWGQFEYVPNTDEYVGEITILPNLSDEPRYFVFFFTKGNGGYELKLIQESAE